MTTRPELQAQANMLAFSENPYHGRFFVLGMDNTGENAVQIYGVEGRSDHSRNRVLSYDATGRVFTEPADPSKMKDPSLIIYNAMKERDHGYFVVSNGEQTDKVVTFGLGVGEYAGEGLFSYQYEPDVPNFTPRITGICFRRGWPSGKCEGVSFTLAILRKSLWGEACDRHFYTYDHIEPGFGFYISTYTGNGDPLPSFAGEPRLMPIEGDIKAIAKSYWEAMDTANRVALAVKFIPLDGKWSRIYVINQYDKVG